MIQTQEQLRSYLDSIESEHCLGIDTEFRRIDTYYPQLCLVQISTANSAECIDVLSIPDLSPLFEKLYREETVWVVHSARQDIEACYFLSGQLPNNLFDTQIAAALVNLPLQVSYQALTEQFEGVLLEKAHTRFDWTRRPLPSDVIEYALNDVRYLLPLFEKLQDTLRIANKLDWLSEETSALLNIELYDAPINKIFQKIKGISRLNNKYHKLAFLFCAWREDSAKRRNKPRKWIMSDERLLDYACNKLTLSSKSEKAFNNFVDSNDIFFKPSTISNSHKPLNNSEKNSKITLQERINNIATAYNFPPELMITSKSLTKYIRGDLNVSLCRGWRAELFNKEN
ncbi:MAG: ribonuclease D [Gammaproteobacteria bacterium]